MERKMTYEEAKNLIDDITWKYNGNSSTNKMICECRDKCREALDKQILFLTGIYIYLMRLAEESIAQLPKLQRLV